MGCLKLSYHSTGSPSVLRVVHSSCQDERVYEEKIIPLFQHVEAEKNEQKIGVDCYVLNNPLKYNDKSGEFWHIIIGAAVGVITNGFNNLAHGRKFFKGAGQAAFLGAIGGAFSFGIGDAAKSITSVLGKVVFQTVAHGTIGGFMSGYSGGAFGTGFLSGAFGSLAGAGANELMAGASNGMLAVGIVGSGALIGGITSELSGGSFWDGARNGAISAGLNHAAHAIYRNAILKDLTRQFNKQLEIMRKTFTELGHRDFYNGEYFEGKEIANATFAMKEFVRLVKTGGTYDLKNNPRSIFYKGAIPSGAFYDGDLFESQDFGNYAFGVAAKAFGLSLTFSKVGAGLYQIKSGTSSWGYLESYYDDPRDGFYIKRGYKHFK